MNGTPGDDTLIGTTADDNIEGLAGDDNILGLEGNDTLDGGDDDDTVDGGIGNDTITGGSGNDTLIGGRDNDSLDGGTGIDTADYTNALAFVIVDLSVTGAQNTIGAGVDTLLNIENITGSAFNDSLTGTTGANVFTGNDGDDTFVFNNNHAASGDDIRGGDGVDTLRVGDTSSATSYNDLRLVSILDVEVLRLNQSAFPGATNTVDIFSGQISTFSSVYGDAGNAVTDIINVHLVNPSSFDNSAISFNDWSGDDDFHVIGSTGVDIISLTQGINSSVDAGAGSDIIKLQTLAGHIDVDGGADLDVLSYENSSAGVSVDLSITGIQAVVGNHTLQVSNIENLTGSIHDDVLTGDGNNNVINTLGGTDTVQAGGGDDTIVIGSTQAGTIDGGTGTDIVQIGEADGADYSIDIRNLVLSNIEQLDLVSSQSGETAVSLSAGHTIPIINSITDERSIVTFYFDTETTLNLGDYSFQNWNGAGSNNGTIDVINVFGDTDGETITASIYHDRIAAGAGDDTIIATANETGIDDYYGGEGYDTVDFSNSSTRVQAIASKFNLVVNRNGVLFDFEKLIGSAHDDYVSITNSTISSFGSTLEWIEGGDGNDAITARSYSNYPAREYTLYGGNGSDALSVVGGSGHFLDGGAEDDNLQAISTTNNGSAITLNGGTGNDTFVLGSTWTNYSSGSSSADMIVQGGEGDDLIKINTISISGHVFAGGAGADIIEVTQRNYVLSLNTVTDIEGIRFHVVGTDIPEHEDFYIFMNASQFGGNGVSLTADIYGDNLLRANNILNVSMDSVTTELDLSGLSFHDWVAGRDYVLVGGDGDSETITTTNFGDVIGSAGGDDTIFALGGDDTVNGDAGNDVISGGFGDDIINGGAGFDAAVYTGGTFSDYTITDNGDGSYTVIAFNGQGTDTLTGIEVIRIDGVDYALSGETFAFTQGDDNVDGTSDDNVMSALGGNDTVHGLDGNDTINGGAGNDLLYGDAGADNLFGGTGNDWFYADVSDTISGGDGYDTISFVDLFAAGVTYNDIGAMGIERVFGTHLDDVLNASSSTVRVDLYGYEGADTLIGGAGNDYIHFDVEDITGGDVQGGAGYDYLLNATPSQLNGAVTIDLGARGFEGYFGSDANEVIDAATSSQFATIYSGGGTDTITGSSFNDYVFVVDGNSTVTGGTGFDYIVYNTLDGSGFSFVLGGTGMEGAIGRDGNDSFDASGVATFVTLYGYGGNDTLIGGDGVDAIYGGTGNDTLTGGASQDNFVFYDNWGDDTVTDFADGTDVLIMSVTGLTSFAQLSVIQDGADALISYGGQSIRLTGVTASNLDALNFEFSPPAGSSKPLDQENSVMEDYINALFANSAQHDPMVAFLQDVDRSPPEIINTDDPFETAIFDDSTFDFF